LSADDVRRSAARTIGSTCGIDTRPWRIAIVIACAVALTGCSPFDSSVPESKLLQSGAYVMVTGLNVPKVRGEEGCGAQSLATMIGHLDAAQSPEQVADELPWHDVGATPVELLLEARHRGLDAAISRGSFDTLVASLGAARPVLIMLDGAPHARLPFSPATPAVMHWAVVSGVAVDRSRILLAGKDQRHHVTAREDFEQRWLQSDNCMIVVTPREVSHGSAPSQPARASP
jgi:ABC-type bacteriocin/lantibiotic exporter with double-glycine peptidase domain